MEDQLLQNATWLDEKSRLVDQEKAKTAEQTKKLAESQNQVLEFKNLLNSASQQLKEKDLAAKRVEQKVALLEKALEQLRLEYQDFQRQKQVEDLLVLKFEI